MTYAPNFQDPRIQRAARKALTFVELYTKSTDVSWISVKEIYRHFGNTTRPLGRWLKQQLLTVKDDYYNIATGQCKRYTKNSQGVQLVKELLNDPDFEPQLSQELRDQIESGDFAYEEKSHRLFNPVQFIPKRLRNSILHNKGYRYHYDIVAAAPNLLRQRALQLNPGLKTPALDQYLARRTQIRQQIAQQCQITENQAKTVVNALLQGGVISSWSTNKIFQELNYDYDAIKRLNNNEFICELKQDIREIWQSLRSEFPVRYLTDKSGKTRRRRLSGREKSELYRELESSVGVVIRRYLKKNKCKSLWIHDGWACDKAVDPNQIVQEVRRQTGFVIELDWTIYED